MKRYFAPGKKVTLLGQSWGGGLASYYAATFPDSVGQLALIEPMPLTGEDMQKIYKTIIHFTYDNGGWNNMARNGKALSIYDHEQLDYRAMMILKSTMTSGYHCDGNNPPLWDVYRVGGYVESIRNKRLGNPVSGFTYNFTKGLERISDTVLVLGGSCSSLGYAMQKTYTAPHFSHCRTVEIKNAGHRMNIEKFQDVSAALHSFFTEYK